MLEINTHRAGPDSPQKLAGVLNNCVREYAAGAKGNNSLPLLNQLLARLNGQAFQKIKAFEQWAN